MAVVIFFSQRTTIDVKKYPLFELKKIFGIKITIILRSFLNGIKGFFFNI
jgi:hypothetical protein